MKKIVYYIKKTARLLTISFVFLYYMIICFDKLHTVNAKSGSSKLIGPFREEIIWWKISKVAAVEVVRELFS